MPSVKEFVARFIDERDQEPRNGRADFLPDQAITPEFVQAYEKEVLAHFSGPQNFHEANEILFDFIPPAKQAEAMAWLNSMCNQSSASALCKLRFQPAQVPSSTCPLDDATENEACIERHEQHEAYQQIHNPSNFSIISSSQHAELYQKIFWYAEVLQQQGFQEYADHIKTLLLTGKMQYLSDLKIGDAWFDPASGTITFSKAFFEDTWGEYAQIRVSDERVLKRAQHIQKMAGIAPSKSLEDLRTTSAAIPTLNPETIRATQKKDSKKSYHIYFGSLPTNAFPPEMPLWLVTLPHEIGHLIKHTQELSPATPLPHLAYYSSLRDFISLALHERPDLLYTVYQALEQEEAVAKKLREVSRRDERQATRLAIKMAKKIWPQWKKSKQ